MAIHRLANFRFARVAILGQQLGSLDRHSVIAGATMRGLDVEERLLEGMKRRRIVEALLLRVKLWETLECGDRFSGDTADRRDAGADFDAVGKDGAGSALRK